MREKELKEELELCTRSFLEARERSKQKSIDEFDELRILEASFNRLFLSVEHLCNAIMLFEKGNFSKKHFGDINKLKELKDKYQSDLEEIYKDTYSFRSYADYRKFPEIKDKFKRAELKNQIKTVGIAVKNALEVFKNYIEIEQISNKLNKETK